MEGKHEPLPTPTLEGPATTCLLEWAKWGGVDAAEEAAPTARSLTIAHLINEPGNRKRHYRQIALGQAKTGPGITRKRERCDLERKPSARKRGCKLGRKLLEGDAAMVTLAMMDNGIWGD